MEGRGNGAMRWGPVNGSRRMRRIGTVSLPRRNEPLAWLEKGGEGAVARDKATGPQRRAADGAGRAEEEEDKGNDDNAPEAGLPSERFKLAKG
jgi:hypothetical protein